MGGCKSTAVKGRLLIGTIRLGAAAKSVSNLKRVGVDGVPKRRSGRFSVVVAVKACAAFRDTHPSEGIVQKKDLTRSSSVASCYPAN